jgi:hypothetical protein
MPTRPQLNRLIRIWLNEQPGRPRLAFADLLEWSCSANSRQAL